MKIRLAVITDLHTAQKCALPHHRAVLADVLLLRAVRHINRWIKPGFVLLCLQAGVKLAFGSDSHNLYEIGFFTPHLQLLRDCGYDADPADILIDPRPSR